MSLPNRINKDEVINQQGLSLIEVCKTANLRIFDRALSDVHSPVCSTLNISADNKETYATRHKSKIDLHMVEIHSNVMNIKLGGIIHVLTSIN